MGRIFTLTLFSFLIGTNFAFSQPPPRDLNQIRSETSARNQAIESYDWRNPNGANTPILRNGGLVGNGRIPGSAVRSYVLAAQAETEVKVVTVGSGDTLLVDDGVNKIIISILGIDAPDAGQPFYEESKKHLNDLVEGKKVVLKYSLLNLKNKLGYFPARVFIGEKDIALNMLENGFAWRNDDDKFFFEKKDDIENKQAEVKAQAAKIGIWRNDKSEKPWEYRERKMKEIEKSKKKTEKD
jgi:endonuclease YncB( thermonuclease family)